MSIFNTSRLDKDLFLFPYFLGKPYISILHLFTNVFITSTYRTHYYSNKSGLDLWQIITVIFFKAVF